MIEKTIRRIVRRLFPELTAGMHLPQWARVEKVYAVESTKVSTQKDPVFCVDLKLLDPHGRPDKAMPEMQKVPLPATGAGSQRGVFAYPKPGALVELGFVLGNPNKPFVRTVLIQGSAPPSMGVDDLIASKDADNYYRIDGDNNITEKCLAAADRLATLKQRLVVEDGGTVWVGNETDNVLTLLSDLMAEVITIADAVAAHNHGGSTPNNAAAYTAASGSVAALKGALDGVKE